MSYDLSEDVEMLDEFLEVLNLAESLSFSLFEGFSNSSFAYFLDYAGYF